jgi:thioredoxin reductase (NADPH)
VETIGEDLRQMIRTPLAPSHVDALRAAGKVVTYPKGTIMAQPGERANRFVYVEEGEIEVVNPFTGERHYSSTIGPTQFMGEISLLYGGTASLPLRTTTETRVIEVPREAFLTLMSQIPEMSDIIITVFAARRRRQLEDRRSGDPGDVGHHHHRVCGPAPPATRGSTQWFVSDRRGGRSQHTAHR